MRARASGALAALVRLAARFCVALALTGISYPIAAQQIKPLEIQPDQNGVDWLTGQVPDKVPTLSVPAAERLKFETLSKLMPLMTGSVPELSNKSSYQVNRGATSASLTCESNECTTPNRSGSTLFAALGTRQFTFYEGGTARKILFDKEFVWIDSSGSNFAFFASYIEWTDGERHTFDYEVLTRYGRNHHRPLKVSTNLGYEMRFTYQSNVYQAYEDRTAWLTPKTVTIYKSSDPNTPLARHTYAGSNVTDLAGRVFKCGGCTFDLEAPPLSDSTYLILPGETNASYNAQASSAGTANAKPVGQVISDGTVWTYSYDNLTNVPNDLYTPKFSKITVTGPEGASRSANIQHPDPIDVGKFSPKVLDTTDSQGRTTTYTYGLFQRLEKITNPEGDAVEVSYDTQGNIVSLLKIPKPGSGLAPIEQTASFDVPSGTTPCWYATCFLPEWTEDGRGSRTDYVWSVAHGGLISKLEPADALGMRRKTKIAYDSSNRPIREEVCLADGAGVEQNCGTNSAYAKATSYFESTRLPASVTVSDGAGGDAQTTTYTYDAAGRLLATDGPLPGTADATYARYDIVGRKTWEIGPVMEAGGRPATFTTYRDADDQPITVETGTVITNYDPFSASDPVLTVNQRAYTGYNNRRLKTRTSLSANGTVYAMSQFAYDARNREQCTAVRMNPANWANGTSACDHNAAGSDGPDRITKTEYDTESRVTKIWQGVGTDLQRPYATYEYSPNGQQTAMIDARGYRAEMRYDGHDRQTHWYFPSKTATGQIDTSDYEQYWYNPNGNRTKLRKRDGSVIDYGYDALGRMTSKIVPERTGLNPTHTRDVYYRYDVRDLQTRATFDNGSGDGLYTFYLPNGQPYLNRMVMDGVTRELRFTYDAAGNRLTIRHPDQALFRYEYTGAGEFNRILDPDQAEIANFDRNTRGELIRVRRSTGADIQEFEYDPLGRLSASEISGTPSTDVRWTFTRNPASQILSRTQNNDAYSWDGFAAANRAYTTNGLNQYTTVGGDGFCYDANGNLTADGAHVYRYDVENRLVEMRKRVGTVCPSATSGYTGAAAGHMRYDPLGRLYEMQRYSSTGTGLGTNVFLHDGDALVVEYTNTGTLLNRYVHGPDAGADDPLVEYVGSATHAGARRDLYADARGSIVRRADRILTYDPWGIPGATNAGRFQYTGQLYLPEIGLYYYKARMYSASLGRFLQTDPIGYEDNNNLYAYVGNDPINAVDPLGLDAYYISRPLGGQSWVPFDHAFVAVITENGEIRIFSFEPNDGFLRPSDPTIAGDSTYNVDHQYFEEFLKDPSSVPGNRIDARDETVIAVGEAFNKALTENDVDYDYNPGGGRSGCNSNCAAGIIADEAREADGRQGSHPAPTGARNAPGRAQRGRLDGLVKTPVERRRGMSLYQRLRDRRRLRDDQ